MAWGLLTVAGMNSTNEIVITLPGAQRVDAHVGRHVIHTDQDGAAPTPFEHFLASLGTCAGFYVQSFCAARAIPSKQIIIIERAYFDAKGTLDYVDLDVEVPATFPEHYREALVKVVEQCSVRKAMVAQPDVRAYVKAVAATSAA